STLFANTRWEPRRSRKARRDPLLLEGDFERVEKKAESDQGGLAVGQRIFHIKFGYGRITARDGDKLDIDFEKAGPKKVMESFVEAV
ncbi:MAG: hypothetical protein ACPGNT_11365, partial [Rhodospirillales bacterium]